MQALLGEMDGYMAQKIRIMQFVTGGFSGATSVAVDLAQAFGQIDGVESLLVLRRKKTTTPERLATLKQRGIPYALVSGLAYVITISQMARLCREWKPDILVVHGFPEHILGRWAGLWARVPHLVQVEHNSRERYTPWKLWQSRYLSQKTGYSIGVSEGVANVLREQGLHSRIVAIPNGIDTDKFAQGSQTPIAHRPKDLIMVSRFAKSKDQMTLIQALILLRAKGLRPRLSLFGAGNRRYLSQVQALVTKHDLDAQVTFCAHTPHVAQELAEHKVFVMSSFYEGLNLSVIEAMASGCVVVGSEAVGVKELIHDGEDGFLFKIGDAERLAQILESILVNPESFQRLADNTRLKAQQLYDKTRVHRAYRDLLLPLVNMGAERRVATGDINSAQNTR